MGYCLATLFQLLMAFLACLTLACFLTLAFGMFMFALSFAKDMINCLHTMNESAKTNKSKSLILKQLIAFIDMHSEVKELSVHTL